MLLGVTASTLVGVLVGGGEGGRGGGEHGEREGVGERELDLVNKK